MRLLAASDRSGRGKLALDRAAQLAANLAADLILLSVVDDDQPAAAVDRETRFAQLELEQEADRLERQFGVRGEVRIANADPFVGIVEVGSNVGADLLILGAHRRALLRDMFIGTTIERVIRTCERPVLMVNQPTTSDYRRLAVASDLTAADDAVLTVLRHLGLLDHRELALVHAAAPVGKANLAYVGASERIISGHVATTLDEARRQLEGLARRHRLDPAKAQLVATDGPPVDVVMDVAAKFGADLLAVAQRPSSLLRRLVLGSVTEALLRTASCDVLVCPTKPE